MMCFLIPKFVGKASQVFSNHVKDHFILSCRIVSGRSPNKYGVTSFIYIKIHMSADLPKGSFRHFGTFMSSKFQKCLELSIFCIFNDEF